MHRFTTAEIAAQLAGAAAPFSAWLGEVTEAGLLELVRGELGHEGALDDFQPRGEHFSKAIAPRVILHVISGNTPHAGLQSLLRGLLLGSRNLCKLPAGRLPEMESFRDRLPAELAERVEFSETLPDAWLVRAEAVIVFGSDATVEALRRRAGGDQIFIAHGHRVSLGIVLADPEFASAPHAARDASLFDQRGCLSPHGFYVRGDARGYAERLAGEMERFNREHPRAALPAPEAARIQALREDARFRAALDPARVALWASAGSTEWTVVFDAAALAFTASPLDRVVFVQPLPDDLPAALANVRPHLGAIGLWPATLEHARWLEALGLGASRFCPIGRMQAPPLTWRQDGAASLAALARWVDFEPTTES